MVTSNGCLPLRTSIASAYPVSHDLNFSNRPVQTRMPGGVAGAQSEDCPLCRLAQISSVTLKIPRLGYVQIHNVVRQ